jgi:hypothetical protein
MTGTTTVHCGRMSMTDLGAHGPPMTLGNMRELGVQPGIMLEAFEAR